MPRFRPQAQALHYLLRGHGEPLLLIHGLGSSGADWAMQVAALESRFRLIVPDLPGCGHSGPLPNNASIGGFAELLWQLLDHLGVARTNIAGFSLGGAVALEMAVQRPDAVARLALINSLASYDIDHWRRWLEARGSAALVSLFGMRIVARLFASRMFPLPWQGALRERAARVIGTVPAKIYRRLMTVLTNWSAEERLSALTARILMIAAEHDYTPIAEKRILAARLRAALVVILGSRHGTPFDSIDATNACLLALFTDHAILPEVRLARDERQPATRFTFAGSLAEEHALGP
jgi:pimeloyl-ACP methyl ester carboxylesterase